MRMGKTELQRNDYSMENYDIFTPEDFTDDEVLIAKTTEQFVKQEVAPQLASIEQHNFEAVRQLFQQAGELGLLSIEVPEAYDGLALDKKVSGLVAEKMGFGGSFSISFNIHAGVGTLPYVYFGNEEQKKKYLPKLASGEWIGAYALTEPDAGSDALQAKTNAKWNEDGTAYLLNGEKQWITNAKLADVFVVFAKTIEGMTAFIVERKYNGVSVGPEEHKMGIKGSSTATLILEDVSIPKENVLGEAGKGHHVALNILNMARLKLAFSNIGTAKQALQLAVGYGVVRKQFKKPLVDFTMIQEKIANMAVSIFGAESTAYRTAGMLDEVFLSVEQDQTIVEMLAKYAMECAINKVNSSEILDEIVDEAVQIHGGYGYMQDYEVERLYRDARISRIFEGTNEINRLTIAKLLLKKAERNKALFSERVADGSPGRNNQYMQLSQQLLQKVLKALFYSGIEVAQEQEYLRLLADMMKDYYVMESAFLRTEKAKGKNGEEKERVKCLVTDILCEERYRQIEAAAVSIISGLEANENARRIVLDEIRQLPIPLHENLFKKKREIAKIMTDRGRYYI